MSTQGPSNPLGDRPRMAEALASLKEGLRDTADPLYDGWKRRPKIPAAANPAPMPAEGASPPDKTDAARGAEAAETIDITLEGTPDETPITEPEPETPRLSKEGDPERPRLGEWLGDGLPTEELLIEVVDEVAPSPERRMSVQTDTVRVRIIRYQPFPRWALVIVAALLVFAGSVVALRARFPRDGTRSARSVLASEVPTTLPAAKADRAGFAASGALATPPPAAAAPPAPSTQPSPPSLAELDPAGAPPALDANRASPSAVNVPPAAASPSGKTPSPSPRRRPGGHDFFRDPGF